MNKRNPKYDVFISYRRSDGFETAQLIYYRLETAGYRVAFDMETLRSGKFDEQLYEYIDNCNDFILVVSKDALQLRENREDDWVRLEVAHAIKSKKNIIPVFLRDVQIPAKESLPEDIADLPMYHGVTHSKEHFNSSMAQICKLLVSKRRKYYSWIFWIIFVLAVTVLSGVVFYQYNSKQTPSEPVYPTTINEKQEFSQIYSYLVQQLGNVNLAQDYYNKFLKAAEIAVQSGEIEGFKDEKSSYENALKRIKPVQYDDSFTAMAQRSKVIDAGDLKMFPQIYENYVQHVSEASNNIEALISPYNMVSKSEKLKIIKIKYEFSNILADGVGLSFIALLHKVKSSDIDDFKKVIAPKMTAIPIVNRAWPVTEEEIVNLINGGNEKLERLLNEETAILGNMNRDKAAEEKILREQLKQQGASDEQIERMIQKINALSRKKAELAEMQNRFKETQRKAREKFAPKEGDSDGILWSKMIALKRSFLPLDALKVLDAIRKNKDNTISEPVCKVAETVLTTPQTLPFVHGVVVGYFEKSASHAIFQPGDVITKVNEKDCMSYDDFRSAEGVKYTVYRMDAVGKFQKLTLVMPGKQPRTLIAELPL